MAGEGYKLFVDDEVLYANDVNGYLMDQAVMVFDNATDRNGQIISLSEGMISYTKNDDLVRYYNGTSWLPIAISSVTAGSGLSGGGSGTSQVTLRLNVDAKGDILVGTANDTVARVPLGTNNQLLVVDTSEATGVRWSGTLSGLTLTTPVISQISNTGTISLPTSTDTLVGRNTTDTLTNKTLTGAIVSGSTISGGTLQTNSVVRPLLTSAKETWQVITGAATGTINLDVLTSSVVFYTANATGNPTFNIRGDGTTTLSSLLGVGECISVALVITNGATAYYPTTFRIDGVTITPSWQGAVPTSGNANSTDVWLYAIVKTVAPSTYRVFASATRFL